jgi:hypothetical protein
VPRGDDDRQAADERSAVRLLPFAPNVSAVAAPPKNHVGLDHDRFNILASAIST